MFKQDLLDFLLFVENNYELDEWYLTDFKDINISNLYYETGYSMLIDCCEVWIEHPQFTEEIIDIISTIRNIISTNTFPDIFVSNKQKILTIYSDTDNRVLNWHVKMYEDKDIELDLMNTSIKNGIANERRMFSELFKNSNIKWFC